MQDGVAGADEGRLPSCRPPAPPQSTSHQAGFGGAFQLCSSMSQRTEPPPLPLPLIIARPASCPLGGVEHPQRDAEASAEDQGDHEHGEQQERASIATSILMGLLYLLRHGDAEEGDGDDDARRLTPKGERQAVGGR